MTEAARIQISGNFALQWAEGSGMFKQNVRQSLGSHMATVALTFIQLENKIVVTLRVATILPIRVECSVEVARHTQVSSLLI